MRRSGSGCLFSKHAGVRERMGVEAGWGAGVGRAGTGLEGVSSRCWMDRSAVATSSDGQLAGSRASHLRGRVGLRGRDLYEDRVAASRIASCSLRLGTEGALAYLFLSLTLGHFRVASRYAALGQAANGAQWAGWRGQGGPLGRLTVFLAAASPPALGLPLALQRPWARVAAGR